MSTSVSWNGSSYTVPATGEEDWGGSSKVDGLLVSLAQNALSKAGGTFALTAEVDFSSTAGLKSLYYKSRGTNVSTTGVLRLANLEGVGWRNAANGADLLLTVSGSDRLQFNSVNVPTISSTDTLTNKTLTAPTITAAVIDVVDNSFAIKDNSDATKIAQFQCSGITTGTTRTYTLPDTSDTLVTLAATQTLTNKTLDGVTVTTALASTGIAAFDDGATGFKIFDAGGHTKGLVFDLSGATTLKTTTIAPSSTNNRTITLPDATTTLVGTDVTQTLTNKTLTSPTINTPTIDIESLTEQSSTPSSPSSGTRKFYVKQDGNAYLLDSSGNETAIGSGSSSGVNYITNGLFETAVTGWSTYADAAGSSPVDGTGGSPTTTFTRSTSSPLRSAASGLITKDAANRQGEGVGYAFTIASADQAKVLNISFEYAVSSSFASGDSSDVRIWIYDVTNSALIPVSPYTIQGGSTGSWKFSGTFQTASNSTSYRLIFHIATTNASAWTMKIDSVVVGPQIQLYGAPIGDWDTSRTFTTTGFGTLASSSWYSRRVGDSLEVQFFFEAGTTSATAASIDLPSGYTIDTGKITGTQKSLFGTANASDSAGGSGIFTSVRGLVLFYNGNSSKVTLGYASAADSTSIAFNAMNGSDLNTGCQVAGRFTIPISGWSSSVVMSNDTDTRVVSMRASASTTAISSGANGTIIFPTKAFDTHGAYNSSTGVYTVPVSGKYQITCSVNASTNQTPSSADTRIALSIVKNSSTAISKREAARTTSNFTPTAVVSGTLDLVAGDLININLDNNLGATFTCDGSATNTFFEVSRLSGPSAIAATEKVYALYVDNGGQALTADVTNTTFSTKVVDSHGAWSGTAFTAPRAGWYDFKGNVSVTGAINTDWRLYINSVAKLVAIGTTDAVTQRTFGPFSYYMNAGDTASFRVSNNCTLSSSSTAHWIAISSQG